MKEPMFQTVDGESVSAVTTDEMRRVAVEADCVVTLALPKTGLAGRSGALLLADIGFPNRVDNRLDIPPFGFDDYVVALRAA